MTGTNTQVLNIIIASTNLFALPGILYALQIKQIIDVVIITLFMMFSILYHLSSSDKGLDPIYFLDYSYLLLILYKLSMFIFITRVVYIGISSYKVIKSSFYMKLVVAFCSIVISEHMTQNVSINHKILYTVVHSILHIYLFKISKNILQII